MHNEGYDDLFFASPFVNGMKEEIRDVVQVPTNVDRALLLAKIQQRIHSRGKNVNFTELNTPSNNHWSITKGRLKLRPLLAHCGEKDNCKTTEKPMAYVFTLGKSLILLMWRCAQKDTKLRSMLW